MLKTNCVYSGMPKSIPNNNIKKNTTFTSGFSLSHTSFKTDTGDSFSLFNRATERKPFPVPKGRSLEKVLTEIIDNLSKDIIEGRDKDGQKTDILLKLVTVPRMTASLLANYKQVTKIENKLERNGKDLSELSKRQQAKYNGAKEALDRVQKVIDILISKSESAKSQYTKVARLLLGQEQAWDAPIIKVPALPNNKYATLYAINVLGKHGNSLDDVNVLINESKKYVLQPKEIRIKAIEAIPSIVLRSHESNDMGKFINMDQVKDIVNELNKLKRLTPQQEVVRTEVIEELHAM